MGGGSAETTAPNRRIMWTMLKWATLSHPPMSMPRVWVGVFAASHGEVQAMPMPTGSASAMSAGRSRGRSRRARAAGCSAAPTHAASAPASTASPSVTRPGSPTAKGHHHSTWLHPSSRQPASRTRRGSSRDVGTRSTSRVPTTTPAAPSSSSVRRPSSTRSAAIVAKTRPRTTRRGTGDTARRGADAGGDVRGLDRTSTDADTRGFSLSCRDQAVCRPSRPRCAGNGLATL